MFIHESDAKPFLTCPYFLPVRPHETSEELSCAFLGAIQDRHQTGAHDRRCMRGMLSRGAPEARVCAPAKDIPRLRKCAESIEKK